MKKILLLSLVIVLNSCIASMQKTSLNHREYDGVKEGLISKELGQSLVVKGIEKYSKGVKMESAVNEIIKKQFSIVYDVNLRNGEILYLGGTDKTRDFYFSKGEKNSSYFNYDQGIAINRETKQKYLFFSKGTRLFDKEFDFQYSETEFVGNKCNECFKQELIYNGKSGDNLKIIYREFNDNISTPAYVQNLSYDLSKEDLIRFQGCEIKVLTAENTKIEFIILSTFN